MDDRIRNAQNALRRAHEAGDAAAAQKLARFLAENADGGAGAQQTPPRPVLAHEELIGGRVEDMGRLQKMGLGLTNAASRAARGVADLGFDVMPPILLRRALEAGGDFFDSDTLRTAASYMPQKPEFMDKWGANNELRSHAISEAGPWAQGAEFAGSLVPDLAALYASRGASLKTRLGTNTLTPAATTDGDMVDRSVAGALGGGGYAAGATAGGTAKQAMNFYNDVSAPFSKDGRLRTVGNALEDFSTHPKSLLDRVRNPDTPATEGYRFSLAESIPSDPGLAQLQRTAQSSNPYLTKYLGTLTARQNRVVERHLNEMSGATVNPRTNMSAYDTARQQRQSNAATNYGRAESEPLVFSKSMSKRINNLTQRPAMQDAIASARVNLANQGKKLSPEGSFQGLQQTRDHLSRRLAAMRDPRANHTFDEIAGVQSTLTDLDRALSRVSPSYGRAQKAYKKDSVPVNQMDVANLLRQRLIPAANEHAPGSPFRLNTAAYQNSLRDRGARDIGDSRSVVKQATGMNKPMDQVMNGRQMYTIESIAQDLARRQKVGAAGKVPGESITAQLTSQQDILDRTVFPFMKSRWAIPMSRIVGSITGNKVSDVAKLTQRELARALVDPRRAEKALTAPKAYNPFEHAPRYMGITGSTIGNSADYYIQN